MSWVASAYLLALAGTLLYTGGFIIFILGSAPRGFAPSLLFLIGAPIFQAIGAALLQANSVAILIEAAGLQRRGPSDARAPPRPSTSPPARP